MYSIFRDNTESSRLHLKITFLAAHISETFNQLFNWLINSTEFPFVDNKGIQSIQSLMNYICKD